MGTVSIYTYCYYGKVTYHTFLQVMFLITELKLGGWKKGLTIQIKIKTVEKKIVKMENFYEIWIVWTQKLYAST